MSLLLLLLRVGANGLLFSEVTSSHMISQTGGRASKQIPCVREPIWRSSSSFHVMVNFCVVLGCSNHANREKVKGYHRIPQLCWDRSPKGKLWVSNVKRLGLPVLEGKILQLTLLNFTEFALTILYQVRHLVQGTVNKVYCSIFAVVSELMYLSVG